MAKNFPVEWRCGQPTAARAMRRRQWKSGQEVTASRVERPKPDQIHMLFLNRAWIPCITNHGGSLGKSADGCCSTGMYTQSISKETGIFGQEGTVQISGTQSKQMQEGIWRQLGGDRLKCLMDMKKWFALLTGIRNPHGIKTAPLGRCPYWSSQGMMRPPAQPGASLYLEFGSWRSHASGFELVLSERWGRSVFFCGDQSHTQAVDEETGEHIA